MIRKEFVVTGSSHAETSTPVSLRYDRLELAGGLDAIISPIGQSLPVTLSLWVRAGTDHEPEGASGVSHVARHVLLDASVAPGSAAALAKIRLAGGSVESWTTRRWSVLELRAPDSHLDAVLTVLSSAVAPLEPSDAAVAMAAQAAAHEADRWHDDPELVGAHRLHGILTGSSDPGLYPDPAVVGSVTAEQVVKFNQDSWSAQRMVLGAALSEKDVTLLSSLPAPVDSAPAQKASGFDPPAQGPVVEVVDAHAGVGEGPAGPSTVVAGVILAPPTSPDGAAAEVLATALGSRGAGGVTDHLPEELFIGSPEPSLAIDDTCTLLSLSAQVAPGSVEDAVEAMATALSISLVLTPGDAEMSHAAARLTSGWMTGLTDPFRAAGLLARHETITLGAVDPEEHLGAILATTAADGARLGAAVDPAGLGFVVVPAPGLEPGPTSGSVFAAASRGVETVLDELQSASQRCEPEDGIATSEQGTIQIVARRTEGAGSVAVTGMLGAGALAEGPGSSGTTKLLSVLMARSIDGAVHSSAALDPAFVRWGSVYAADHVGVYMEVPPEAMVAAVLAVRSALLAPVMDVDAFESARQICLAETGIAPATEVEALREALGSILALPSALDPEGSISSIGLLTREGVRQFHAAAVERGAVVSLAGELDPLEGCVDVSVAVSAPLGHGAQPAKLPAPSPASPPQPSVVELQGPGSDAVIVAGFPVVGLAHPGRWAIEAVTMLLDGPSGILTREIVVERSLAQKCSASYWSTGDFGVVILTIHTPATNVQAVANILPVVIGEAMGDPPTDEQMLAVRAALLSGRAHDLAVASSASRVMATEALLTGGFPDPGSDEKSVGKLEADDIVDVLSTYFDGKVPTMVALAP